MPTVDKTVSPSIEAVPLDLTIEHFDHTPQSSLLQQLRQKTSSGRNTSEVPANFTISMTKKLITMK